MRVVFLGEYDWANTSNRIARAINRCQGAMRARVVTRYAHPYEYPEDVVIERDGMDEAATLVSEADWVIGAGDANYAYFAEATRKLGMRRSARKAIRHSGTVLRDNPETCEQLDQGYQRRFVPMDMWRMVKHCPRARVFVQPQDAIASLVRPVEGKVRICHTPSERRTKGTKHVMAAMRELVPCDAEFFFWEKMSFAEIVKLRNSCQVYIDQLSAHYGNFGAAACEAMSQGLAVVGDMSKVVENPWIAKPPILDIRTKDQMVNALRGLVKHPDELERVRQDSLIWAQEYLSPEFTYRHWAGALL